MKKDIKIAIFKEVNDKDSSRKLREQINSFLCCDIEYVDSKLSTDNYYITIMIIYKVIDEDSEV